MPDETRHSKAREVKVITEPQQLARLEAYNTVQQYLKLEEMIGYFLDPKRPSSLTLLDLN